MLPWVCTCRSNSKQWKHWPCGDFGFQLMLWVWDRLIIYSSNGKCLEASFAVPFAAASGAEITHSTFKEHRFPRHELAWPSLCFCQNALHHFNVRFVKGRALLTRANGPLQGSRVRPIWSHMRPNFSRVRLKKNFSRTGASSHSRKQNKSLRDSESLSAVRQQTR